MTDTIYALSSGAPPAAVAVVRISGPHAGSALGALAGRLPEPRRATLVRLRDTASGETLDMALGLWFPGPASATGEDLAEFHLHGGRAVVARVLAALAALDGLAPAGPGDFTRRAFENGRIDLAEAEGLSDLLFAETELQRRNAMAMAGGALSRQVEVWQERLLGISAEVEALLDFSDEDDVREEAASQDISKRMEALRRDISTWLARPTGERLRDGIRVALAGPPNAGKSTLINALSGREAAIVSDRPGTTRDVIEVPMALKGRPFVFLDLAGLRDDAGDEIEAIGISKARAAIDRADIVLALGYEPVPHSRAILVHAQSDRITGGEDADVRVSAVEGEGMQELVDLLVQRADSLLPQAGDVALNTRQRELLAMCSDSLAESDEDLLVLAESLRHARRALDRLTGRSGTDDMLDALFGKFCIGK